MIVANGNSFVFERTGVQFTLSNQELKQMLTTNHSSFIINIQQVTAELIAKAQEQAIKSAYQIIGTPITIEVLAQNDQASPLHLPGLGQIVLSSASNFTDVADYSWYTDAVATLAQLDFMNGYPDGTYRPSQQITREEAMVIVARVMSYLDSNLSISANEVDHVLAKYGDQDPLSNWSRTDIALTVQEGIIMGNSGQLSAKDNVTRCRLLQLSFAY